MDLGAPSPKRLLREDSSSGGGENNKACVVLYCRDRKNFDGGRVRGMSAIEYYIFIIDDLKSDVPGPADAPTVSIQF